MVQAVDVALDRRRERVVLVLSAGRGAGTTSVAWAYARASAAVYRRRVLVLDASGGDTRGMATAIRPVTRAPGLLDALNGTGSVDGAIVPVGQGLFSAALVT